MLTSKILEIIVAQWQRESDIKGRLQDRDMSLKTIAQYCDQLMDYENLDESRKYTGIQLTGKKVGNIVSKQLHLQTQHSPQLKGRYAIVWDQTRIDALRKQYGISDARITGVILELKEIL